MNFEMQHPADQIVTIMNRIYHNGMTTTSGGNLSIMDADGVLHRILHIAFSFRVLHWYTFVSLFIRIIRYTFVSIK